MGSLLRYAWASPNTLLGIVLGLLTAGRRGRWRVVEGVLEVTSPAFMRGIYRVTGTAAQAVTIGHVVMGLSPTVLEQTRAHERVHVRQYERWGPLFIVAYVLNALWQWWRGRDWYRDNAFEVEAYSRAD